MLASALVLLTAMSQAKAGDFLLLQGDSRNFSVVTEVCGPEGSTLKVLNLPTASSFIMPLVVQSGELGCPVITATDILAISNITFLDRAESLKSQYLTCLVKETEARCKRKACQRQLQRDVAYH